MGEIIKKRPLIIITIIYMIVIVWGLCFEKSIAFLIMNKKYAIYESLDGAKINIIATIVSDVEEKEFKYIYKIKYKDTYFRLEIKKYNNQKLDLQYGDEINLSGMFKLAEVSRNYKGFNYRQYLKTKKISGIIQCDLKKISLIKKNNLNFILMSSNKIRNFINENINKNFSDDKAGILSGLLIGDTSKITKETKEDFRDSSLSHILAVSGSHVIYLTLGLTYLIKFSKINKRIADIALIIVLIFFMFVTGFSASVVRACIMGIIVVVGKLLYKKPDIINSISLSLLITLIYNPFWIKDIGLLLSYGGVLRNNNFL